MDINNMTLEQKVGQMIVAGFPGEDLDEHIIRAIKDYHIGNVIYFTRNFKDVRQFYNLNKKLQNLAVKENKLPLFTSIDQEGGMVTRINKGATFFPGNMVLSAGGNEEDAFTMGTYVGEELKALGVNMNLAPVLDVNNNPDNPVIGIRSYGEEPERVAKLGSAYINGLQKSGVIATGKHFPGHGDTSVDSHLDLSSVNHDAKRLNDVELYPFKKAIECGVGAIMSAHVMFPAYEDKRLPATLSYKVLTGLLREKLGFNGLIITDCMEMKAIDEYFGIEKAPVMAVKAGADLICISHTLEKQIAACSSIVKAVRNGEISESRINESLEKIIVYKNKLNTNEFINSDFDSAEKIVSSEEHRKFAQKISENGITILKGKKIFPLKENENILFISTNASVLNGADDSIEERSINKLIEKEYPGFKTKVIDIKISESEIEDVVKESIDKDKIIICTYNASLNKEQVKLVEQVYKVNKNIIVIAMRNPYDCNWFKYIPCCVLTYEYTPNSIRSVMKLLNGSIEGMGKCPVALEV